MYPFILNDIEIKSGLQPVHKQLFLNDPVPVMQLFQSNAEVLRPNGLYLMILFPEALHFWAIGVLIVGNDKSGWNFNEIHIVMP